MTFFNGKKRTKKLQIRLEVITSLLMLIILECMWAWIIIGMIDRL